MQVVIFIGSLVGILTVETVRSSNPTEFFGDYYARSAVNDVKRVQMSYIKKFRYLMADLRKYYCQ